MADISKINAIALANIAKLDAVDAANIAKVNGLVFSSAPAFTGLLDTYTGAQAGYSVRRLSNSATNLMRIREDAGDTETDIGYDSNNQLDTAAIATHCGTSNGYVVTWYDQAGSNNATQGTEASQPQIYDGSAVITDNGKPALYPNGLGWFATSQSISDGFTITNVFNHNNEGTQYILASQNNVLKPAIYFSGNTLRIFAGTYADVGSADTTAQAIYSGIYDAAGSGNIVGRVNGSEIVSATATAYTPGTSVSLLSANGSAPADHTAQEIVVWSSNQRSAGNIAGIELNVNSNYLIYQPTDTPTSGLLATYSGAAAAYSVRQLANTAVMSMRVRRDSDDEELNFGFDSNGDLDTAGIAAFCGSANGYVSRWWDQSTNGNHADQATDTSQPQIYNGSAVITENGKPAVSISETYWETTSAVFALADDCELFTVFSGSSDSTNAALWVGNPTLYNSGYFGLTHPSNTSTVVDGGWSNVAYRKNTTSISPVNRKSLYDNWVTGNQVLIGASAENLTDSNQASTLRLMAYQTNTITGNLSEYIVFNSDQSSNRTGIESNVNTYFSIY